MPSTLSPRRERFSQEYLLDANATQAAVRAGYSAHTARIQGPRLLNVASVAERIAELQTARAQRLEVTADAVVRELAKVGFASLRSFVTWGPDRVELRPSASLNAYDAAAVAEVWMDTNGPRIRLHDKPRALEMIGRHLGLFRDVLEVRGSELERALLALANTDSASDTEGRPDSFGGASSDTEDGC